MNSVEIVKKLCKERNVSIARLEKELGFSNGYIGKLKKGVFPTDKAMAIANYFGLPLEYLQTGKFPYPTIPNMEKTALRLYLDSIGWSVIKREDYYIIENGIVSVNVSREDYASFEEEIKTACLEKIRELVNKSISASLLPVAAHDNDASLEEINEDMKKL